MDRGVQRRLEEKEFKLLREKYNLYNIKNTKRVIYRVGSDGGFYSEICKMLEGMIYCYLNDLQFVLYADNANFSNKNGWNEFFEEFCEVDHHFLNRFFNRRFKRNHTLVREAEKVFRYILKLQTKAAYLTDEIFSIYATNKEFRRKHIQWELFDISGEISKEYPKLIKLALRYNIQTYSQIKAKISELQLPEHYISVQMRGGDKAIEVERFFSVDDIVYNLEIRNFKHKNLFLFTDEYKNVEKLKKELKEWNIYTMAKESDKGYDNRAFGKLPWIEKREALIGLFAMVEICLDSEFHLGDYRANPNNIIRGIKREDQYADIIFKP